MTCASNDIVLTSPRLLGPRRPARAADEMGLGKTIQSLSFLAALKDAGLPGPHLVVTPLAVLQNWANEIKRFTPGLRHVKIHGGLQERDRLLSREDVLGGEFDVYLTT